MKKYVFLFALLLFIGSRGLAQGEKKFSVYAIGFYNLENLFDTCHDEGKNDYEYLPEGSMKWNGRKYSNKLRNMSRVLSEMGTDMLPKVGCAAIGVSEVENAKALTDLVAQPALAARGYKFCHIEGEDKRGVDCALLYNPKMFTVRNVKLVPYVQTLAKDSSYKTRGFLTVSGTLAQPLQRLVLPRTGCQADKGSERLAHKRRPRRQSHCDGRHERRPDEPLDGRRTGSQARDI